MSHHPNTSPRSLGWLGLSPLFVFLAVYLLSSLLSGDFYRMPIAVAFLVASGYALLITRGVRLEERIRQFSHGAADSNILLMIWIFVLAGAFAQGAKSMGAIDATVNTILSFLPSSAAGALHRLLLHLALHRDERRHGGGTSAHRTRGGG